MKVYAFDFQTVDVVKYTDGLRVVAKAVRSKDGEKFGPRFEKVINVPGASFIKDSETHSDGVDLTVGNKRFKIRFFTSVSPIHIESNLIKGG